MVVPATSWLTPLLLLPACAVELQIFDSAEASQRPVRDRRTVLILAPKPVAEAEFQKRKRTSPSGFRILAIADPGELRFPPRGKVYRGDPASWKIWRMLATEGVDLVLTRDPGLTQALLTNQPEGLGRIPVLPLGSTVPVPLPQSPAHQELGRRAGRSPPEMVALLRNSRYGREFPDAVYVPGMSLIARMRIGESAAVRELALPFAQGSKDSLRNATGSHLAGHLVFAELAERFPAEPQWRDLVVRAANLGFVDGGEVMREAMPFHTEMSDAVFMSCPLLAKAGKLTGERRYFDMLVRHFRFMQNLCKRSDGLYRHSPLAETAWGRGNAFPLLGLALALQDFPRNHPGYGELLTAFRNLARELKRHQATRVGSGMWHQIIDDPQTYAEYSATAMIGRAYLLGIRNGWLSKAEFQPAVDAAWKAVAARTSDAGDVLDVCESTGKQKSAEDYRNREAIAGFDTRGGGMAFLFAIDLMQ